MAIKDYDIYYGGRLFRPVATTDGSDTTSETIFKYEQKGDMLTGTYAGGDVYFGHLIGTVDERGRIDMRYHHMTENGDLMTGICQSTPEIMSNGKIRLYERWRWTCGNRSKGRSTLEEL
ncbi:n-acetylglutamate synthase [Fretibacter rubidus]|uniref:n-acetylglutamate synthase n=1 Tax=Fretibacter rubidus TaxID=570162 RepID=UPI00352AD9AF